MTALDIKWAVGTRLRHINRQMDKSFRYGTCTEIPNAKGVVKVEDVWFIYTTNEHSVPDISGPFTDNDIIHACAKLMGLSEFFEDYPFSNEARQTYSNTHYKSLLDAMKGSKK